MKQLLLTSIVFLAFGAAIRSETSHGPVPSPEKVVADLYKAHDGKTDPLQSPQSRNLLGAYFDKGLLALFLKDQAESQGEVGKLDFDPLYDAQDFTIKGLAIAMIKESKGSAQVAATFKNMGTSKRIVFSLSKGAQGWRIFDINYGDGRTLKGILK